MNLLEMFEKEEERYSKIGAKGLHRLKYIYDSKEPADYGQMSFELKTIFNFIDALQPAKMNISIDRDYMKIRKLEFNPTISRPNITVEDRLGRGFSIWYKPIFYVLAANSSKPIVVDFVVMNGMHDSMYDIDASLEKELYTYEFMPDTVMRDVSMKLLSKLKEVYMCIFSKKVYLYSDLNDIKAIKFFVKPKKLLMVSEDYLPKNIKLNVPIGIQLMENIDINSEKFKQMIKRSI